MKQGFVIQLKIDSVNRATLEYIVIGIRQSSLSARLLRFLPARNRMIFAVYEAAYTRCFEDLSFPAMKSSRCSSTPLGSNFKNQRTDVSLFESPIVADFSQESAHHGLSSRAPWLPKSFSFFEPVPSFRRWVCTSLSRLERSTCCCPPIIRELCDRAFGENSEMLHLITS